ncbi:MAG: hybrid sensor histidine kinase/response regulator, partial [Pseudomonadota bacterium]|nr:hybrid sensor histidine kinase/response regulator [Pseudomonadota bacterium]
IVLSDFRLPGGMTGLDVMDAVRTDFDQNIPGVLLTGESETSLQDQIQARRISLVTKPVNPACLHQALVSVVT